MTYAGATYTMRRQPDPDAEPTEGAELDDEPEEATVEKADEDITAPEEAPAPDETTMPETDDERSRRGG